MQRRPGHSYDQSQGLQVGPDSGTLQPSTDKIGSANTHPHRLARRADSLDQDVNSIEAEKMLGGARARERG